MDLGSSGRCVIVTGGSGGIGLGLVLEFAREGANVAIASRDAEQSGKVAEAAQGLPGAVAVLRASWSACRAGPGCPEPARRLA